MMIANGNAHGVECDRCAAPKTLETSDWRNAIAQLKAVGWRVFHTPGAGWSHHCPTCANADLRQGRML